MKPVFYGVILLMVILSACTSADVKNTPAPTPGTDLEQPMVTPAPLPAETMIVQTPQAGKSTLTGILLKKDTEPQLAYQELKLYLGVLLTGADGQATLARVNPKNAPVSLTDQNGQFQFVNIEPGTYILVAELPPNNLIKLNNTESGKEMLITLEADGIIDLGTLYYDFPFDFEPSTLGEPYPSPQSDAATPYPAP